jgi:methionyl-tRNA synthetase
LNCAPAKYAGGGVAICEIEIDQCYVHAELESRFGCYHEDLANGLGNLVNRTVSMIHKYRGGTVPALQDPLPELPLTKAIAAAPAAVDAAIERFDFRQATAAVWKIVDEANRYVVEVAPWNLAKAEKNGDVSAGDKLNDALALLIYASRTVAEELTPFLPDSANRVAAQLGSGGYQGPGNEQHAQVGGLVGLMV